MNSVVLNTNKYLNTFLFSYANTIDESEKHKECLKIVRKMNYFVSLEQRITHNSFKILVIQNYCLITLIHTFCFCV
jgi:hypothetical protein